MTLPRHRLTRREIAALPVGPLRDPEAERRYFHAVGIASRIRVHRELAGDGHEFCPICEEPLR